VKRLLVLVIILAATADSISAQKRLIARGASEGELYISGIYGGNYGPWGDTLYSSIDHITENGKKLEIQYRVKLTGDTTIMQPYHILADATPGVLYNDDYEQLWFSDDYGKTWEVRDKPLGQNDYVISNVEGTIYRGSYVNFFKSTDYGQTFIKSEDISWLGRESGLKDCEFFSLIGHGFYHTYDCFQNYINLTISDEYVLIGGGIFPDVFRGSLPGEVYVTSASSERFIVAFSADTGYNYRIVHQRKRPSAFMSDRKAGDFYIVTGQTIKTQQPYGWHSEAHIEYYTDYGETLVGIYCHDLAWHYPDNHCLGVMDLQAEVQDKSNIFLQWKIPETDAVISCFRLYRNDIFLQELQGTTYLDDNLPDGSYTYHVKALYTDGCETLSYNKVTAKIGTQGIASTTLSNQITVYPNPTTGMLYVETHGRASLQSVEIFDLMGRTVGAINPLQKLEGWQAEPDGVVINISNLPDGMYFIRIQTENEIINKKIVKY